MRHYCWQTLIALDQLINALLGGWADETYSSRAYRLREEHPWRRRIIDIIFTPLETDHCEKSYNNERDRMQLPVGLRINL